MILRLICPSGHVLDVDAQLAGRKIRCGACGRIMVVPAPARGPVKKPGVKPAAKWPGKPIAKQPAVPPAKPQPKKPTAEPPPATTPSLPREPGMVAVPLPPVEQPEHVSAVGEAAIVRHRSVAFAIPSWLRKLWPPAEKHLPADATIPGWAEQRIALRLAAVLVAAAMLSLTPVIRLGHANLLTAPPWALAAVFLAVLQVVYAVWMINVPDWVSAWVQMVVCAIVATIYGMLMTKSMITPANSPLILNLGEIRHSVPAWSGLMLVVMGAATWFCGRTSAKWRRSVMPRREE
ncbi:MAG: hypothetical protein ABSG53_07270 [Thermoguttaceae bacterium]|jgi:hypothetical protein